MMLVKCKACSKRYDYHEHGCCPECGAYNRPPYRNRVGADGVVHRMNDADFLENTAKRRGSQSGKVCFEQDVCFEDQARSVRSGKKARTATAEGAASRFAATAREGGKKKSGTKRIIGIVVAVILVTNVLPLLLTTCSATGVVSEIVDELFGSEISWDKPVEVVVPARPDPDLAGVPDIAVGQTFLWWGADACVTEVTVNEADEGTKVDLTLWVTDPQDKPAALYRLRDGTWVEAGCEYVAKFSDNDYVYSFYLPDRQPGSECYILFSGNTGGAWCRSKLPLMEGELIVTDDVFSQERAYAQIGETFSWWDEEVRVAGVDIVEGDHITEVLLTLRGDVGFDAPSIAYWNRDSNEEMVNWCDEYGQEADGWWHYRFSLENRMAESDCWAVFADEHSAQSGTVWVLLNE